VDNVLERLERVKRNGGGWTARCPSHQDREPSLSVAVGDGDRVLLNCHAGCTTDSIVAALGLTMADLFDAPASPVRAPDVRTDYVYEDEEGQPLFRVVRTDRADGGKTFWQQRRDGQRFVSGMGDDTRRVLYHLSEVAAAATVHVVEGEKCADALRAVGVVATTAVGGAGAGKWKAEYAASLSHATTVYVWPDCDDAGREHADHVVASLEGVVADVRVVDLGEDRPDKYDVADLLADAAREGVTDLRDHAIAAATSAVTAAEWMERRARSTTVPTLERVEPLTAGGTAEADNGGGERNSWEPMNLALTEDKPAVEPTIGSGGIVYPGGRHLYSGEPSSLKTVAAYAFLLEEIRVGNTVLLVDFEMGWALAKQRLREMGATDDDLASLLYVEPDCPPTAADLAAYVAAGVTVAVIDAIAGAYDAADLDDGKRKDVERFSTTFIRPLWQAGIATILIDHVVKAKDSRGRYSIGSERKMGGVDVHLGFEIIGKPFSRGHHGHSKIVTHKDRLGYLTGTAAELHVQSDPATHRITWTFQNTAAADTPSEWRPTRLMEKVSLYLERPHANAPIRADVDENVKGRREYVLAALDYLIQDGYAAEAEGTRTARHITLQKPYREAPVVPESFPPQNTPDVPQPFPENPDKQAVPSRSPVVPESFPEPENPVVPVFPPHTEGGNGNGSNTPPQDTPPDSTKTHHVAPAGDAADDAHDVARVDADEFDGFDFEAITETVRRP